MLNLRSFALLCVVTLVVSIAAVLVSEDTDAIPGSGQPLFPDLMSRLNDIEIIQVESAKGRYLLKRSGKDWVAPDKHGYPANGDKVHKLLLGAAGLNRVEPKTSNPELYSKLGLAESGEESSRATTYSISSGSDSTLVSLMVGKSAPAKGDPDLSEFYVRLPDQPRVWLVEGKLPTGDSLGDWLQREIAGVDRARVRQVRVQHASGEVVTVLRESSTDDQFRLKDGAAGKSVDGQWKLNDIGRVFSSLDMEDVLPRREASIEGEPSLVVSMQTFDGLEIRMRVFGSGKDAMALLEAGIVSEKAETAAQEQVASPSAGEVREEAASLNARWKDWAFVLPEYKVSALARTQSELLKESSDENTSGQS